MQSAQHHHFLPNKHFWPSIFRSAWFGYIACVLLVVALLIIEKIDEYIPQAPIFVATPFAMVSIFVAMLWGIGPALFSVGLGLFVLADFISPGIFSFDMIKDTDLNGPFVFLQLVAIAVIFRLERFHRQTLAMHHALEATHQELEVTHQKLIESNQQLKHANELKDYVITRASHEFRTPLTTILGRTQLFLARLNKSGETPENWAVLRDYLKVVEVRSTHLRKLIETLFDLSRITTPAIPFQKHPCNVGTLCQDMLEDQRELSGRMIDYTLPSEPLIVQAEEALLAQVFANLLNNAIKYSPEHSPIHVRLFPEGNQAVLRVQNECETLSSEQLERVFDLFYRTTDNAYSDIPGWGIGLAICKEIVERHGGHIRAESPEGEGMIVFVKLPLTIDETTTKIDTISTN